MKLYEIETMIAEAIERMFDTVDEETGEISQEAMDELEALNGERTQKIENIALYIKNLKADVKAFKEEEDAIKKRRMAAERKVNGLETFLQMHVATDEKISTPRTVVSFRRSMKVNITNDALIPDKFLRIKTEPDKVAIKHALDEGVNVDGAELIENYSLQIK